MAMDDSRTQWLIAVFVLVLGAWAFLSSGDEDALENEAGTEQLEPAAEGGAPPAEAEAGLSYEDRLESLRVQAEKLQLSAPEDQIVEARRRFVDEARALGDEEIGRAHV